VLFNNEEGIGVLSGRKPGTLVLGVEAEAVGNRSGTGFGGSELCTLRARLLLEGARILPGRLSTCPSTSTQSTSVLTPDRATDAHRVK